MTQRDYYDILGIDKTASEDTIKRAFRKLAMKYHPDVNKEPDAEAKMKEINEAYSVLSDANKRADYDRFGHASNTGYAQNPYQQQGQYSSQQQYYSNFDDLFNAFFAQQQRQQQQRYQNAQQNPPQRRSLLTYVLIYVVVIFLFRFIMSILFAGL